VNLAGCLRRGLGGLPLGTRRVVAVHLRVEEGVIVQTVHKPRAVAAVEKIVRVPWEGRTIAERADALRAQWIAEKVSGDAVVCTYPHRQTIVKSLTLPTTKPREIEEMVRFQACRQTPLPSEEIAASHYIVDHKPEGYSRLFMIVTRKEDILRHLEVLHQAGFPPNRLVLDSLVSLPLIRGERNSEAAAVVVDLERDAATIGLFQGMILHCARSFSLPGEAGGRLSAFRDELWKTLIKSDFSQTPLDVYLAGEEGQRAAVKEALQKEERFRIHEVDPSQRIAFTEKAAGEKPVSPWPALGAGLESALSTPSLLPEGELRGKNWRGIPVELLTTLILSLTLVTFSIVGETKRFFSERRHLLQISRQEKDMNFRTRELRSMQLQTRTVEDQMARKGSFLQVIAELNKLVPGRISIQDIAFERDQALQIQGTGFSLSEILNLVGSLQKSPLFSRVELVSSNSRGAGRQEVTDFQLSCRWGSGGHRPTEGADL